MARHTRSPPSYPAKAGYPRRERIGAHRHAAPSQFALPAL